MPASTRFFLFLALAAVLAPFVFFAGCANIVPPQGGPRDSIPPVLEKVTPPDSTRGFNTNRIVFTFDEYVDLQNVQSQLNVSPALPFNPDVTFRLNTVTVRFRDTLDPNTTYSIEFGNAVRDYTEGNPINNFRYTFSTGPYIDSLELRGKVVLAETGKVDSTLIVMLHADLSDSAVIKERPRYVTRLNAAGEFIFRNLPPRSFRLYALKDESGSRRYNSEKQLFAFASDTLLIGAETEPQVLFAYSSVTEDGRSSLPIPNVSTGGRRTGQGADNRLRVQTSLGGNPQDLLSPLELRFDNPIRSFDSNGVRLYVDSAFTPVASAKTLDSSRRRLTISTDWLEGRPYHLILDRDFADDSTGKKLLKTDTISFSTRKLADYGNLALRFKGLDPSTNPVLQIVQNNAVYLSAPLRGNEFNREMFPPGDYELRILFDENGNGRWDPGNFFGQKKQPEIVQPIDRKITVRANWKNEIEIQL